MKVSKIELRGISGLPDLEVDWAPQGRGAPFDLVLVSGPAASGKTRFLEAILAVCEIVGPYEGLVRPSDWVAGPAGARIDLDLWLNDAEQAAAGARSNPARISARLGQGDFAFEAERGVARLLSRYEHDDSCGKREYFPETRQVSWGSRADGTSALEQSLNRCGKGPHKYSFLPRFLTSLSGDAAARRRFEEALEHLAPTLTFGVGDDATWFSSRGGSPAPFSALSGSEAEAILFAATAAMIRLCHSMVLLDRPELLVSPDRIVGWVGALSKLGTDNQWIVATNSPELLASVSPAQIVSLGPSPTGGRS